MSLTRQDPPVAQATFVHMRAEDAGASDGAVEEPGVW